MGLSPTLAVLIAAALLASPAEAQRCKKGIPCGNSCISASKTCRVGAGTATKAGGAPVPAPKPVVRTTAPIAPAPSAEPTAGTLSTTTIVPGEPAAGGWIAAKDGKVYYFHACELLADIDSADRRHFRTEALARAAGYTRSKAKGC